MSTRYAADDNQPYQPLNNIDRETGQPISDSNELKRKKGPFFSCDGDKNQPHFHSVDNHPETSDTDGYSIRQLHVPGYDQHDANISKSFASIPPFHIATGWHIADPETNSHMAQFNSTKKFDNTTDNDEATSLWKEECEGLFGKGAVVKRNSIAGDTIHEYMPGKDQPEEQEEPQEEQEQQEPPEEQEEQEEQEQEKEENTAPSKLGAFSLEPGQKAYSIVLYPAKETEGTNYPAFSRTKVYEGHANSSDAQKSLLQHADRLDMINTMQKYRKSDENPDAWEDLFKRSMRNPKWYITDDWYEL
jgi:hypothetical protein